MPSLKGTLLDPPVDHLVDLVTVPAADTLDAASPHAAALVTGARADLDPAAIVLGPTLGEGGMGVVHLAQQPSLRREVAVKRLRPERTTPAAVTALLREAWVTGTLEHPSIVPVHLLLPDRDGSPQVVMKRIEGVTWETLLTMPTLADEFAGRTLGGDHVSGKDRLLFHLRILADVCQAISFAHSRGILHLDLKPENVMVGRFGEVYVVDWGIAAGLPERGPHWLPSTTSIQSVRGTPSWIAPELAAADGPSLGPATDVYLLGGLLHYVLTGEARHPGDDVKALLEAAWRSEPWRYDATVPSELAELANRATARLPADRPASADAFRAGIERHLAHRDSIELGERAIVRTQRLLDLVGAPGRGPNEGTQAGQSLRQTFLECRFAFQRALEVWPENSAARDGLHALLRGMADYALRNQQLERATECISELSPRDPELERRLNALGAELLGQYQRLKYLERDADVDAFHQQRSLLALGAGTLFIVWNVLIGWANRSGLLVFDLGDLLWLNALTLLLFGATAFVVRDSLLTTATNRRLVVLFGSGFVAVKLFWLAAWVHARAHPATAMSALEVVSLTNWVYLYFVLALTFTMDTRAAWVALPSAAVAVLAPFESTLAFELLGLEGFLIGIWLAIIWRRPRKRRQPAGPTDPSPI
ncbi:MAG: serine/threonine protein kinase [Deltaproteobacteria bacterium]|nr:serine/threonine protein kinase [Deltaproteobacteria bacterium]